MILTLFHEYIYAISIKVSDELRQSWLYKTATL